MMEAKREIKGIIEDLSKKKEFNGINTRKLMALFESAAIDYPAWEKSQAVSSRHEIAQGSSVTVPFRRALNSLPRPSLAAGIAAALFIVFAFGIREVFFSGPGRNALVTSVAGRVSLIRDGDSLRLSRTDAVKQGDIIISDKKSLADMDFGGVVRIRMTENTSVSVESMTTEPVRRIILSVERGSVCVHVDKLGRDDKVCVNTPVSVGLVRGTLFGVKYNQGKARYEVFEGKVRVSHKDAGDEGAVVLEGGRWARIVSGKIIHSQDGTAGGSTLSMSDNVLDFILDSGRSDPRFDVVPIRLAVTPSDATVAVDGIPASNGTAYLSKGKHRIEATAEGYRGYVSEVTVAKPMQIILIGLDKKKTPLALWSSHLQSSHIYYNPLSNRLITVDDQGLVAITDFKSVQWSFDFNKNLSGPPYEADGILYISFADGTLASCDYNKSSIIWTKTLDGTVPGCRGMMKSGSSIFAFTDRGALYRIDRSGAVVWRISLNSPVKVQPASNGHTVFVALKKGWLYGISCDSGEVKRKVFLDDEISAMNLSNDAVYISTLSGNVYNYNCSNDTIQWSMSSREKGPSDISVDDKAVYVYYGTGHVVRLDLSGRPVWEHDLGSPIFLSPAEDSRSFYFTGRNNLFVVSKGTGEVLWSVVVPSVLSDTVALSRDKMFIVSSTKGLLILNKF